MREIKFRAWCPTNKMMYYPYVAGFNSGEILKRFDTIMQYTGLKDKNGKEIYEGDIVAYLNCYTKKTLRKQIAWDKYSCGFCTEPIGHTNLWHLQEYLTDNKLDIEVVGNIYENIELLEKKK